ncbi:MAG: hypothetical protein ACFFBD_19925, partial [Candidatus Hodarchaeota archaeon]
MTLDLNFDPASVKQKIISVIKRISQERDNSGVLITFGGQTESYIVIKLAIEAVGLNAVHISVIREIGDLKKQEIVSNAKKYLGIPDNQIIVFDIDKFAKQLDLRLLGRGVASQFESGLDTILIPRLYNIGHSLLRSHLVRRVVEDKTYSIKGKPQSEREKYFLKLIAQRKLRKRLKMVLMTFLAESGNLLLLNETNKTQWLTGLFTTFGYGHIAEIMPLGDLYRTQLLDLGKYLGLPHEIQDLTYSNLMPGIENQYQYFFELDYKTVDQILIRLQADWSAQQIAEETGM